MHNLNKRLDGLEVALAPEGRPFVIWAMIDGRRMTKAEIDAAFQEAIASGRAKPGDKPLAISWVPVTAKEAVICGDFVKQRAFHGRGKNSRPPSDIVRGQSA